MELSVKTIRSIIVEEINTFYECCGMDKDPMQDLDDALAAGDIGMARQILADIRATDSAAEVPAVNPHHMPPASESAVY
jgi:hypothetical protein